MFLFFWFKFKSDEAGHLRCGWPVERTDRLKYNCKRTNVSVFLSQTNEKRMKGMSV